MPRTKPDLDTTARVTREDHREAQRLSEALGLRGVKYALHHALAYALARPEGFASFVRERDPNKPQGVYVDPRMSFAYEDHKGEIRSAPMASEPVVDPELDALLAEILG